MKTRMSILIITLLIGGLIGAYINKVYFAPIPQAGQLKLEEILSIKELHLVKHSYNDLFFLHRKNDASKAVRAIARVPVSITAYINLKEIRIITENDTIRKVILPAARLNPPAYSINKMSVTKTRSFQLHAGKDHYPEVAKYLSATLSERSDSIKQVAIENKILEQAEAEGKDYIENILIAVGRPDIIVTFGSVTKDRQVSMVQRTYNIRANRFNNSDTTYYSMASLVAGSAISCSKVR